MHALSAYESIILAVHFIICIFMIIVILLQAGKGADMGAAFGAGSSQTLFGARGASTFLSKMTTGAAILFLLTSISLAAISKNRNVTGGTSVLDEAKPAAAPAAATNPNPVPVPATNPASPQEPPKN